jgi:hypothetical protein
MWHSPLINLRGGPQMARTIAELPKGTQVTDYITLGVLTRTFPLSHVKAVLISKGKASHRQRDLPAHVMVYDVIALPLFMQVSYRRGAALFAGGPGMAAGAATGCQGDRQVGDLAGAHPLGMG